MVTRCSRFKADNAGWKTGLMSCEWQIFLHSCLSSLSFTLKMPPGQEQLWLPFAFYGKYLEIISKGFHQRISLKINPRQTCPRATANVLIFIIPVNLHDSSVNCEHFTASLHYKWLKGCYWWTSGVGEGRVCRTWQTFSQAVCLYKLCKQKNNPGLITISGKMQASLLTCPSKSGNVRTVDNHIIMFHLMTSMLMKRCV